MNNNPYEILHLEEDATYDEIKERYRHLTRSLHPDKQPLQNYQTSKKLFQQVDQAYKSIASPLRRLLFKEYGLPALKILDQIPSEFHEFDVDELSPEQLLRLKQLMIFYLYDKQASFEMDKTKFVTKSLVNVSKPMRSKKSHLKKNSKRNLNLPELQNASFEYQMVLPEVYGFSNSIAFSQFTNNIRNDPKYSLVSTFSAVRRLYTNYMLTVLATVSGDESNFEIGFDKICENNLHLKITPISIHNFQITKPKFGIDKSFNKFHCSALTDLDSVNFDFNESSMQKLSRSLKIYMEKGSLTVIPRIEWQFTDHLRLFAQLSTTVNYAAQQNNLTLRPSLLYGYKLTLHEDLKIELTSSLGAPNYYQVAFINSKFRASIPFITGDEQLTKFQIYKVAAFILVYFTYRLYHFKQKRDKKLRQKLMKQQQNRLKEQKRELTNQISYLEMSAADKKVRQIKYNGLVVMRALIGQQNKINEIHKRYAKAFVGEQLNELPDEVEDVSVLIQHQVVGAQIINYNLQQLLRYNPCIYDNQTPYLLLLYTERGQYKTKIVPCQGSLSLGGFCNQYEGIGFKLKNGIRKTVHYFFGQQNE